MHVCGPMDANGVAEVREYATTTEQIRSCVKWLQSMGVQSVAMESTGVYWIPVLEVMEASGLETLLVDTRPLSRVPGRKSDVIDCEWSQQLHSCGLLAGCYRPSEEISQIRMIVRQKAALVAEQSDWVRRMHKSLDQMNVRVHRAVKDVQGKAGMAMIKAIIGGERDPEKLADLREPECHKSKQQMQELLDGNFRSDHVFNLTHAVEVFEFLGKQMEACEVEIQERLKKLTPADRKDQKAPALKSGKMKGLKRRDQEEKRQTLFQMSGVDLLTIDGIGTETAEVILSEYGADLSKFPTEHAFVSHLRLAPNKPVTGGKPMKKKRTHQGGTRTGELLRTAATTLRTSASALGAHFRHLSHRKGAGIAVFATARKLATYVYRLLRFGQPYVDEGQRAYEERYQKAQMRHATRVAATNGYELVKKSAA